MLPIDRTAKAALDANLVNGILSDAPKVRASESIVYDTIDELYNKVIALTSATISSANIPGVSGSNTYDQLVSLKSQITSMILGQIPDGTITLAKLAADVQARINQIYSVEREVINLKAVSTLANRVDGASGLFYDLNDGLNGGSNGKIDFTTTNIPATTSIGVTSVTVNSVTGFAVGQEVTILDDVNLERVLISAINTGTKLITFTASLTKAYKANAQLCRSSVVQDTTNKLLKFGGWSTIVTVAVTSPTTVVASAYDTSGNGGSKFVRTTNGNLISIEVNGTTIQVQKSIDNGVSFQALCTITGAQVGAAIAWNGGNNVTILWNSTTVVYSNTFDVTTVTNTDQNASKVIVDNACTSIVNNVSIKTGTDGIPQATWSGVHPTYPNSKNLRYSKATTTSVTVWAAPTQVSQNNLTGADMTNPCIVVKSNNSPAIVNQYVNGTNYTIYAIDTVVANATTRVIYNVATYSQVNPCLIIKQNGSNLGRIIFRWNGLDATDTAKQNERWSYSDDGGVTWSAVVKITTGNTVDRQKGVLAEDASGNIYNIYMDNAGISYQQLPNGSTTWGAAQSLNATGTNPAVVERLDFSVPLTVYMDASQVKFKGTWTGGGAVPVLVEDVRYNITPPSNVSSIVAWVDHDADANFSVAGAASFQASVGNESYTALTKTTAAIDSTHNEDQFVGSGTANAKATLRLTMTRNSTSLSKSINQITGAVGA